MSTPRVIIVEDEAVIALMLEMLLEELGCEIVKIAGNVQDAIRVAEEDEFDYAFIDINLNGQKAHVLPSVLTARRKRFAFVTGYGDQGVLEAYATAPVVAKPFNKAAIALALAKLKGEAAV